MMHASARQRTSRGFTLVELMIVVVIVGVLATLAVVGYRRIVTSSHSAEATQMVNAIRVAQEAYRAETGTYADISLSLATTKSAVLYPTGANPGSTKFAWGGTCTSAQCNQGPPVMDWNVIPVHVDGPVMYGFTTVAGNAGAVVSRTTGAAINGILTINGVSAGFPTSPINDWFVVTAIGDANGDGVISTVVGSSFTNDLWVDRDGE